MTSLWSPPGSRSAPEYVLHACGALIDLGDDALNELEHLLALGQIAVGGVGNPLGPGPGTDGVLLDPDQGREVGPLVADHDCLSNERRCLQGVLQLRRRDVLAAGGDDDVLDAIDDLQVRALDPFADISGVQPALGIDRVGRGVWLAPVSREGTRMPGEDLAGSLGEDHLDPRVRLTHGAELDPSAPVAGGNSAVLRHSVELVDDHPHGEEEEEDLG